MKENIPAVKVEHLTIGYNARKTLLEDISFQVKQGEIFCILGGSGCGKSTLLKHLIGLYEPLAGSILIQGRDIVNAEGTDRREIMRGFGIAYQSGALFGSMTVAENVALPLEEYTTLPPAEIAAAVEQKLQLVDLAGFGNYMPSELSGGMKKRAAVARAMALDPKLLFFDEPSAGLDPITSAELDRLILELRDKFGTTVIVVTHELDSIFTIADRVIMLDKSRKAIVAEGVPADLREHSDNDFVRSFLSRDGLKTF
jgi:phospholipid/cholesterol/gamma-HCH transport system ATP-binding protein